MTLKGLERYCLTHRSRCDPMPPLRSMKLAEDISILLVFDQVLPYDFDPTHHI